MNDGYELLCVETMQATPVIASAETETTFCACANYLDQLGLADVSIELTLQRARKLASTLIPTSTNVTNLKGE